MKPLVVLESLANLALPASPENPGSQQEKVEHPEQLQKVVRSFLQEKGPKKET